MAAGLIGLASVVAVLESSPAPLAGPPAVIRVVDLPVDGGGAASIQSLAVARDGSGFFVGGTVGLIDLVVTKFSDSGDHLWSWREAAGVAVLGNAVAAMPDGGVVAVAPTETAGVVVVPGDTGRGLLVVVLDADGGQRWRHVIPETAPVAVAVAADDHGRVYVGGQATVASEGGGRAFVRSYEYDGQERWTYRAEATKTLVGALVAGPGDGPVVAVVDAGRGEPDDTVTAVEAVALDDGGAPVWRAGLGEGLALTAAVDAAGEFVVPAGRRVGRNEVRMVVHRVGADGTVRPTVSIDGSDGLVRAVAATGGAVILGGQAEARIPGYRGLDGGAFLAGYADDRLRWAAMTADYASTVWGLGVLSDGRIVAGGATTGGEVFGAPSPASGSFVAIFEPPRA